MEQFPWTSTVMHYNVCISAVISALIRKTPWQQSNRTLVNACAWVCVPACVCARGDRLSLCLHVWVCICMHLYLWVCEHEVKHAEVICRSPDPSQFTWKPITAAAEGKCLVPRAKNKRDAGERITMKRQNWMMSAEMQRSGSSEGPVCFDKTNSFLLEEPRLRHMKTLSCWEKMELMEPELSSPHS